MEYRQRIRYAACFSVVTHACAMALGAYELGPDGPGPVASGEPIVISLADPKPVEEKKIPRLISAGAPADGPVRETDLISDRDSKAQDMSDAKGESTQPHVEQTADFDDLGETSPAAVVPAEAAPPETPTTGEVPEPEPAPSTDPLAAEDAFESVPQAEEPAASVAVPAEAETPEAEPLPERFDVAQAEQSLPPVTQDLRATRGREGGGAETEGFTSFEANQHALGGYMLELRKHVEREWRMALQLQYSGASRAYAVLKCSITPEGVLERVEIVDSGNSVTYAAMCKRAVESASRYFRPFPFEVPEIYRSKNLEIQWKFSYM